MESQKRTISTGDGLGYYTVSMTNLDYISIWFVNSAHALSANPKRKKKKKKKGRKEA